LIPVLVTGALVVLLGNGTAEEVNMDTEWEVDLSEEEWKAKLTPEEYYVLREKGNYCPRPWTWNSYNFIPRKELRSSNT